MNLKFVHFRRLHISTSYIMVPGKSNYRSGTKAGLFVEGHIFLLYSPTMQAAVGHWVLLWAVNALERVQRVHEPADLWNITFCTRWFWSL